MSVLPVKPSGTGMGLVKVGSREMAAMRKRLEPVSVQGCVGSVGQVSWVSVGRRTSVTSGSQLLLGGSVVGDSAAGL